MVFKEVLNRERVMLNNSSGKTINVQSMAFYWLSGNQIVEEHGLPDMLSLLQQIGAIPAS